MYLQFKIGHEVLDLYAKTKAKFTYYNPAFRKSGGRSLPFTIPKTPKNLRLTGFVDRLDTVTSQKVENASVWLGGIPFDFGVIKMKSASDRSIEIYFEQTLTDLQKEFEAVKIKTLSNTINVGTPSWKMIFEQVATPTTLHYAIEINGVVYEYTATSTTDFATIKIALRDAVNADYPSMLTIQPDTFTIEGNSPVVLKLVSTGSLNVVSQILYEDSVKALWTTYLNNPNVDGLVFPCISNYKLLQNNGKWIGEINFYKDAAYQFNGYYDNENDFRFSTIPYVMLSNILEQLEAQFGFQFAGAFMSLTDIQNLFLLHNQAINQRLQGMLLNDEFINLPSTNFDTGIFLADITAKELVEGFLQLFCLASFWSEIHQTLTPISKADLLNTEVEDWTTKTLKTYKVVSSERQGYRIEYTNDKTDTTSNTHNQPIVVGNGHKVYKLPVASAITRNVYGEAGFRELLYMEQINSGDFSPRLGIYKGLQPGASGELYPKAIALALSDIYTTYWQPWADFLNTAKKLDKSFDLTINDLLKLRTFQEPMKRVESEKGTVNGMISEFSFEADANGLSDTDIEIYTVSV